jgi:hypothetical protein
VLDEKAAAAQALGIFAAEARTAFAPHVEQALATLLAMADYFHDDVRPCRIRPVVGFFTLPTLTQTGRRTGGSARPCWAPPGCTPVLRAPKVTPGMLLVRLVSGVILCVPLTSWGAAA